MSEQNTIRWDQDADGIVTLTLDDPSQRANTMTAAYQTNVARGFGNYQTFWNSYQQVTISDVVATPPSTVVATIHYVGKDGTIDVGDDAA